MPTNNEIIQRLIEKHDAKRAAAMEEAKLQQAIVDSLRAELNESGAPAPAPAQPYRPTQQAKNLVNIANLPMPERIRTLLAGAGKPMKVSELAEQMETAGVKTTSPKGLIPGITSAILRREDLFYRVERGLYGLTAWKGTETNGTATHG